MTSPFDDERLCKARSALVKINPDEFGRYNYDLICQYTRKGLNNLQSGDLIAVENYKMAEDEQGYYSILTLTQATPIHFAAQSEGAYPGHVFESMRTIKGDWESQEDQPRYATTTILYKGIPTNWQFLFKEALSADLPEIIKDDSVPMIGAEMRPLSREMVDAIINYGMPEAADSPMRHKRFEDIRVILDKKALLTTHFGIFGFTNTGKSNLLSSLINSFMIAPEAETNQTDDKKPNFIIIDPNDEYLGLFIDMFVSRPEDLRYIHVGIDSLADRFIRKLNNENTEFDDGDVREFFRQMKLPAELRREEGIRDFIYSGIRNASKRTRIALPDQNLSSFVRRQMREQTPAQAGPAVKAVIRDATEAWTDEIDSDPISTDAITNALEFTEELRNPVRGALAQIQNDSQFATAIAVLTRVRRELNRLSGSLEDIPNQALISIDTLVAELNTNQGRITIVTGRKDSDIKQFAANLGDKLYESRRTDGTGEEPCTTMVLDEADLFIPNLPTGSEDSETETIRNMCVTLARRGRKFRLGIGISTQRAAYLNTQIMGNLHTYFVSKLPRKGDRERVAEAYGIGEEELSPTFSFQPGDWLIISHDATGLTGVPIPVRADNANTRITEAARSQKQ